MSELRIQWGGLQILWKSYPKYIETMPASDEFIAWREGKTAQVNDLLEAKKRNDRLAKKGA